MRGLPWRRISGAALVLLFLAFGAQQFSYTRAAQDRAEDAQDQRDDTEADLDRLRVENRRLLRLVEDEIAGGVAVIEQGAACIVALLFVPPEDRPEIDAPALERVCGLNPAQVGLLLEALDAPP